MLATVQNAALVVTLVCLSATAAQALPPPKTDAELLALADLVVDASVKSIVCDGPPVVTTAKTTTTYISTLWPSATYKGTAPKSFTIRGESHTYHGPPPVGGWHQQPMPEGWVGKLYLKKESDGSYSKVWWNGDKQDTTASKPKPLPNCESSDAGVHDTGVPDAGVPDTSVSADSAPAVDAASADSTIPEDMFYAEGTLPPDFGSASSSDDGGCSLAPTTEPSGAALLLLLGAAIALLGRRRRRR